MADARSKAVLSQFVDQWSREQNTFDLMVDLGPAVGFGDILDIPLQASPSDAGIARADPESLLPTVSVLTVDQEIFFNVSLPKREQNQLLNSAWPSATAQSAMAYHMNDMEDRMLDFLLTDTAGGLTDQAKHFNQGSGGGSEVPSLTDENLAEAEASMLSQEGVRRSDLAYIFHPYGLGNIRSIADYVPNFQGSEQGRLGIPAVTSLNGIPVFMSQGISNERTVAISSVTGGGLATVPAGHGVQVGATVSTVTAGDDDNDVLVTAVTATTIQYTTTGTPSGAGTLTVRSAENLLVDRNKIYTARQEMPRVEIVKDYESPASALQIYSLFGYQAIGTAVKVLHSPPSGV